MQRYGNALYVYEANEVPELEAGGVVVSNSSDLYYLTPNEARAFAADLLRLAGEVEGHRCQPEGDPAQLPSGTRWTCPEDARVWTSVKRMINRTMVGEWVNCLPRSR